MAMLVCKTTVLTGVQIMGVEIMGDSSDGVGPSAGIDCRLPHVKAMYFIIALGKMQPNLIPEMALIIIES